LAGVRGGPQSEAFLSIDGRAKEEESAVEAAGPERPAGVGPHSGDGVDGVQELDGVHGGPRSEAKCLAPVGAGAEPPQGVGTRSNAATLGAVAPNAAA